MFGEPKEPHPQTQSQPEQVIKQEPEKLTLTEKEEKPKTIEMTPKDKNIETETPKKNLFFNSGIDDSEKKTKEENKEKEEKKVISASGLFGEKKMADINKNDKSNEDKGNNKSLFGDIPFNAEEKKEEKKEDKKEDIKEDKKEKLNFLAFEELKDEDEKKNKSLFGDITKSNNEDKQKEKTPSLFGGETSLFGKKEENNQAGTSGLFSTDKNDNLKNNTSLFGFKNDEEKSKSNNSTSLFGKKEEEKTDNKPLINDNTQEKTNLFFNSKGSLATDSSNPFLNYSKQNTLPNVFNANTLASNTNNINNSNTSNSTNFSLFSGSNTNNIFGGNNSNENKGYLFGTQQMDSGDIDMSPQLNPRGSFINNNSTPNYTFNLGSKPNSNLNIFGAPINNNNSIFGNQNLFGNQGNAGQQGGLFFNLGKK